MMTNSLNSFPYDSVIENPSLYWGRLIDL